MSFLSRGPVSLPELILFTNHLEIMLDCGIPLNRALHAMASQWDSPAATCAETLAMEVERGCKFSEALQKQPAVFDESYIHVMRAGEQSGHLTASLRRLGENLEKRVHTQRVLQSALIYPAFLMAGCGILVLLMLYFIFPMVISVTASAGVEPPALTRMLMTLTQPKVGLALLSVATALGLFLVGVIRSEGWGRILRAWYENYTPVGRFFVQVQILETTRQFSLLLSTGVDLLRSLTFASRVGHSSVTLSAAYEGIIRSVSFGEGLAESYQRHPMFPPMLIGILAVSAETGDVPRMLQYFCDSLEEDLNMRLANVGAIIEPVMLGILGTVIGVLLIAAFMPIYNLIQL